MTSLYQRNSEEIVSAYNIVILLSIFLNGNMKTPTNYFLASLAATDLLISLILPTLLVNIKIVS